MTTSPGSELPQPSVTAPAERSTVVSPGLTDRGRLTLSIAVAGGSVLLMSLIAWFLSALLAAGEAPANSTTVPAPTTSMTASAASSVTATNRSSKEATSPTTVLSATAGATTTPSAAASPSAERTMVQSGLEPTDEWVTSRLAVPPSKTTSRTNTYHVSLETAVDLDVDDVARHIASILNDERGWTGYQNNSFRLVGENTPADFTIRVASPRTVDRLCLPMNTRSLWSCRIGSTVALNSDRWLHMTPTYTDIDDYRAYLVNHEVGHYIGLGHVSCSAKGAKAKVMMQQSKSLAGCLPNPWPAEEE